MADREDLSRAAEDHLLVRDEAGQPHRVDRHVASHAGRRRLRRPDGASSFVSAWSSMISACGNERAASAAKRIISTAPSAKFGARKHGIRCSRASASSSASAASPSPVVPITHGTPADSAVVALPSTADGAVKSTAASKPAGVDELAYLDPGDLVPRGAEGSHQNGADLALTAEEQDLHAARATASGLIRSTAARNRFSLGPIPAAESSSGA